LPCPRGGEPHRPQPRGKTTGNHDLKCGHNFRKGGGQIFRNPEGTNNSTSVLHSASAATKFGPITTGLFTIRSLDLHEGLGTSDVASIVLVGSRPSLPTVYEAFTLDGASSTFET